MTEQLKNMLWMGEELEFELDPKSAVQALPLVKEFLESTGSEAYDHQVKTPSDNLESLIRGLRVEQETEPFSAVIDLTRGNIADRACGLFDNVPVIRDFSISRVRQATKPKFPTSGHIVSHTPEELRQALEEVDTTSVAVLDDTSFSGNTSLVVEKVVRGALPERQIRFTHGFLILNEGSLGPNPGARSAIHGLGSRALGGMSMSTPDDDGWHFFDLVKHDHLSSHIPAVIELARMAMFPDFDARAQEYLSGEMILQAVFPNMLTTDELEARRKIGRFVTTTRIDGEFHVTNPQLLPTIISQGHLLPVDEWRRPVDEIVDILLRIGQLFDSTSR